MIFEKKARQLMERSSSIDPSSKRQWFGLLGEYFLRRILRVYPLFMLVVFILWFLSDELKLQFYMVPVHRGEGFDLIKTLMMYPRHRHHLLWSLPIEIAYYFVIPPFCMLILALGPKLWWIPFGPLYLWIMYTGINVPRDNHSGFNGHLPTFLAGSLAAILYNRLELWKKNKEFKHFQVNCLRFIEFLDF
jgi:peptidoglycan/LPS O-acetylase OafA/YrhL